MTRILIVIQARTASTRLPGKVLLPLAGAPLLARMVERVRSARTPFDVVVATTSQPEDDAIVELCRRHDIAVFRGHSTDLLDRHYRAAQAHGAGLVVKIPSDCPLIDPDAIDRVLAGGTPLSWDYLSNLHPASYPDGNDIEAVPFEVLETAWREATASHEREHTTPFLWDRPERFRIRNVLWETGVDYSMSHRFTIDYREDYELIAAIYDELWTSGRPVFSLREILSLIEDRPALAHMNAKYAGVNWYRHHLEDLRTITARQTRSPEP